MYIVLETYADCLPEIPMVTFPTYEEALAALLSAGEHADDLARERGEDDGSGLLVFADGSARCWAEDSEPFWSGRVVRIPDQVAGE